MSGRQAVYEVQPRHRNCLPQARGVRTGKNTIHQIYTLSRKINRFALVPGRDHRGEGQEVFRVKNFEVLVLLRQIHTSPRRRVTSSQIPAETKGVASTKGTIRIKIITGSLVILENLFPEIYRYRYRLEIRMNYHYRYRLGARSHPFISIDSQLPSRKSFELISSKLPLPLPSWNVFELERY